MRPTFRLVFLTALLPALAHADGADALVGLVNAYRGEPRSCEGEQKPMAGVLAPSSVLAGVKIGVSEDLGSALAAVGYRAAAATIVVVTGPEDAKRAMALLEQRYCRALVDRRWSALGIARSGSTWRVVMARPLVPNDLVDWRQAGQAVLGLVNEARGKPRSCGDRRFPATTPLAWSQPLADAARAHSRDMAEHDYFSHTAPDGGTAADRVRQQAYDWRRVGENIAAGQGSPEQVVTGWLASPHHCSNIMSADYAEMGAAYATNAQSDRAIYWTQNFGKR